MPDAPKPSVPNVEVPDGQMRVWDPKEKKAVLVPAIGPAPNHLNLVIRIHDPKEKNDSLLSACWTKVSIPRSDIGLTAEEFAAKHIIPELKRLRILKLT